MILRTQNQIPINTIARVTFLRVPHRQKPKAKLAKPPYCDKKESNASAEAGSQLNVLAKYADWRSSCGNSCSCRTCKSGKNYGSSHTSGIKDILSKPAKQQFTKYNRKDGGNDQCIYSHCNGHHQCQDDTRYPTK